MADTKNIIIGFLILSLVATGIVYISLKNDLRVRVDEDKSTFYVKNENNAWIVSGREYNSLFEGTSKKQRDVGNIKVETIVDNISDTVMIKRTTPYKVGAIVVDTYFFNGKIDSPELFPIYHSVEIFNGVGFIYQYEVRELEYNGQTIKDPIPPLSFGKQMKVEWDNQAYWSTVYSSGLVKVRFRPDSNYERYEVRLFDPGTCTTYLYFDNVNASRKYELETTVAMKAFSLDDTNGMLQNDTITYRINHSDFINYSNYSGRGPNMNVTLNLTLQRLEVTLFNNINKSQNLTSRTGYHFLMNNLSYPQNGNFSIYGSPTVVQEQTGNNSLFDDDFEDGECADWSGCTINSTPAINGTYSAKITSTLAHSPKWQEGDVNFNVTFQAMLNDPTTDEAEIMLITDVSGVLATRGALIRTGQDCPVDGNYCYDDGTLKDLGVAAGYGVVQKYTFEFNTSGTTYNFYVNSTRVGNNLSMKGGISRSILNITTFHRTSAAAHNIYWDDFQVSQNTTIVLVDVLFYPYDTYVYFVNLSNDTKYILPGFLNGTILYQKNLSTGEFTKNVTFTSAGETTIYVNLSKLSSNGGNITIQMSGSSLDRNNQFSQTDFYNDTSNISLGFSDNNASYFWMWDDGTINYSGKYDQQSSGTATFYGASGEDSYRRTTTSSSASCTGGGGSACSSTDNDFAYEETEDFDAEESARIEFKVTCAGSSSSSCGGCGGDPGASACSQSESQCTYYFSGGSTTVIDAVTASETSVYNLHKVYDTNGTWLVYDDGVLEKVITLQEENLELRFRTVSDASVTVDEGCGGGHLQSSGVSSDIRLHYVNRTGVALDWNNTNYNRTASVMSHSIYRSTDTISRAYLEVEEYKPAQTTITYELSNNNGSTWVSANPNTFISFTSTGKNLTYRINLSTNFTNSTPRVRNLKLSIIPATIQNVTIDLNNDGDLEFNFSGELNETNSPQNMSVNFTDSGIGNFITTLNAPSGLFPIVISSDSVGVLEIENLLFKTNVSKVGFNSSQMQSELLCSGYCQVDFNLTYSSGVITANNLNAYYSGRNNVTVNVYSSNSSCTPVRNTIQFYYSKINASMPAGIVYYDVFPKSLNTTYVVPFSQKSGDNNTNSTPIFQINADKPFDWNYSIYQSFAPAVNSCLALTSCGNSNRTNCINVTTNNQLIAGNLSQGNTTYVFHWWNLTTCTRTNVYLPANLSFNPYCQECVVN